MKTVNVKKLELLSVLRENLENHKEDYEVMIECYYNAIGEAANELVKQVMDKDEIDLSPIRNVSKPELHELSYNRAIKMAKMSVDDIIEMTEHEFSQLVMDEWDWSRSFQLSKTSYGI